MAELYYYLIFNLERQYYALQLSAVERVVRMVEITPLPKAPPIVLGVINLGGRIVPVFNIRQRFALPPKEIGPNGKLIIANSPRPMALVVDGVEGVVEFTGQNVTAKAHLVPGVEYVEGVLKQEGRLILIHELAKFLSVEEEKSLSEVLK